MKILSFLIGFFLCSLAQAEDVTTRVIIKDFKFQPAEITVTSGTTVRWENHEKRQYHSVWFEQSGEPEPEYFFPEEFFEKTFNQIGDFPYRCGPHPKMTGIVHVVSKEDKQVKTENMTTENIAQTTFNGYLSAAFGMSWQQVKEAIAKDDLKLVNAEDAEIIKAKRDRGFITTDISYVIPKQTGKLALIVEFYPGVLSENPIVNELEKQLGSPLGKDATAEVLKQIKDDLPPGVTALTLWAWEVDNQDRFIRLLKFDDHIAVEYLAPALLSEP
ncbi:plastocyanin/azurin family copper-binding protein [Candidatus Venteria ishoeyi]|uniref:plastocyanin/azurin family copper-binding protein n=1 Tax=Candidatus Venteria ishoeyi TaxID=1899563 RepID=UPI0025A5B759|nr:plastocyanin/azurin family copper-binding protein [Candidatus Venteria ishoeyi]MDM8546121.1 plastocyanin/azurin family copper-binding protein [Candidatus Venteria ishoeyi]